MKHMKHGTRIYAVVLLLSLALVLGSSTAVQAQQLVIASPGYAEQFSFYVDGLFDITTLSPAATFLIAALGSGEEAPAGTLTLTLTSAAKSDNFLFKMDFLMIGAAYGLNGTPQVVSDSKATPLKIVQKIPINASYGFAAIAVVVTGVDNPGNFTFPAPFTLLVELSAGEEPAAIN